MGRRVYEKAEYYVRRNDRKRLSRLIRKRPDLLSSDESCLVFNAIWCQPSMVRWLLGRGVSPDCRQGAGSSTPLMQAAADGDLDLIRLLIEFGANIEAINDCNERPLGFACSWDQIEAVKLLLQENADPNALEDPDRTQLDWAEICENQTLVQLLRDHGGLKFSELSKQ